MSLAEIARNMRLAAGEAPGQPVRRALQRGLHLTFLVGGDYYQLSLTRQKVYPSDAEVIICRNHFDVPQGVTPHVRSEGDYHVVRLTWTRVTQRSLFESKAR